MQSRDTSTTSANRKLYIFNPDTDLALADNSENYQPTARVKKIQGDLELLPLWYAEDGSAVLATSVSDAFFAKKSSELFDMEVSIMDAAEASKHLDMEICPWGWNPTLRKNLLNNGFNSGQLPTAEELAEYRSLSGRDKDTYILNRVAEGTEFKAEVITELNDCIKYATSTPRCIFKSPWSGSGKGLLWCFGKYDDKSEGWCRNVIREQGFVIATPIYDKALDFALEYYSDGGGDIKFIGYSLFGTNSKGAYQGNILQSDEMHREHLSRYIDTKEIDRTGRILKDELTKIYGNRYRGFIGVDMMICHTRNGYALHPCVEVNMRMNMGVLCAILTKRFLAEGVRATFGIEYRPSSENLYNKYLCMTESHPAVINKGRIEKGFLALTPVNTDSNYMAYIMA